MLWGSWCLISSQYQHARYWCAHKVRFTSDGRCFSYCAPQTPRNQVCPVVKSCSPKIPATTIVKKTIGWSPPKPDSSRFMDFHVIWPSAISSGTISFPVGIGPAGVCIASFSARSLSCSTSEARTGSLDRAVEISLPWLRISPSRPSETMNWASEPTRATLWV